MQHIHGTFSKDTHFWLVANPVSVVSCPLRWNLTGQSRGSFPFCEKTGKRYEDGVKSVSRPKQQPPPQVTFYTKAGCHLCDEAREMLEDLASQVDFDLTEIDIRGNPELFELYRYRIPVIIVNGQMLEGRIEYRDLVRAFHLL